jgi:hypothetical protein
VRGEGKIVKQRLLVIDLINVFPEGSHGSLIILALSRMRGQFVLKDMGS